jgi:hypothetical protein
MPGINTAGTKNTEDYTVGRGRLYISELDANKQPTLGWRFLGNAPQMNVTVEVETLPHQDSTEGLRSTDLELVLTQTATASLQLDEINFNNLALFFSGVTQTYDNSAAAAGGGVTGNGNLVVYEQGRWYDVFKGTTGAPSSNSHNARMYDIGVVSIRPAGGGTPFVEGTDYRVDQVLGRIFIIKGGAITGSPTGTAYDMNVAANTGADVSVDEVRTLTQTAITVAMKFIHINANGNAIAEYHFHQIRLKPEGDLAMIGDEYSTLGLQGVAEKNESAGGTASPTLTIRTHANAVSPT